MVNKIPASVSDVLLHQRDTDRTERVMLPVTRYKNILNAPSVVSNIHEVKGAPFVLFETEEEILSISELRKLSNDII